MESEDLFALRTSKQPSPPSEVDEPPSPSNTELTFNFSASSNATPTPLLEAFKASSGVGSDFV